MSLVHDEGIDFQPTLLLLGAETWTYGLFSPPPVPWVWLQSQDVESDLGVGSPVRCVRGE